MRCLPALWIVSTVSFVACKSSSTTTTESGSGSAIVPGSGATVASGSGSGSGAAVQPTGKATLAIVAGKSVKVVEVSPAGTKVLRDVAMPGTVGDLVWTGADPIAMVQRLDGVSCAVNAEASQAQKGLAASKDDPCVSDPKLDGTIGRITDKGFVAYSKLPDATWAGLPGPTGDQKACESGCWSVVVASDEVWQGHCKVSFFADGGEVCDNWLYARIDKPGGAAIAEPPKRAHYDPGLNTGAETRVAPSPKVTIALSPIAHEGEDAEPDSSSDASPIFRMRCALDGITTGHFPAKLEPGDLGMTKDITWISTEPPLFAAYHMHDGMTGYSTLVLFDRCMPTESGELVGGPNGLVAIVRDNVEVWQAGHKLGTAPGGTRILFAPN